MTTEPEILQAMRRIPRDPETVLAELREHQKVRDDLSAVVCDYVNLHIPTLIIIDGELQPTPLPDIPKDVTDTIVANYLRIRELEYELIEACERRNAERDEREERRLRERF